MVFYVSPHKLVKTLQQFRETFGGDRQISVSRELSKRFEETKRGSIDELTEWFNNHVPKGEFVVIVEGKK